MIAQINKGNIVPFYRNLQSQMRYQNGCEYCATGLMTSIDRFLSFQVLADAGTTVTRFGIRDMYDTEIASLATRLDEFTADGKTWITYDGESLGTMLPCGYYYIILETNNGNFYSEMFHVRNYDPVNYWTLEISNSTNFCDVLYQDDYVQNLHIVPFFDNPTAQVEREISLNGFSDETIKFSRTVEKQAFEIMNVPDYHIYLFSRLRDHDTVTITNNATDETFTLKNIEFTSRQQDSCFNVGRFEFEMAKCIKTGCVEVDY